MLINIYLGIQFNHIQYNHKLKRRCLVLFTNFYGNTNVSVILCNQPSSLVGKHHRNISVLINRSKQNETSFIYLPCLSF